MRILISNDDGIDSPGICALEAAARHFTDDLWIVAPDTNRSAASRAITIKQPVKVTHMGNRKFAVHGTPTDCVLIAMHKLITDKKPDLVLSGINVGSNLATDIGYSGTVAIAIESALQGITAIAFSQTYEKEHDGQFTIDWQQSSETATQVIQRLLPIIPELRPIAFNVNLPTHPIGMRITHHAAMIPTVSIECDTHNNHWVLGGAMSAMRVYSQITKDREPNPEEDFHPQSFEGILLNYLRNNPDVKIESTSDLIAIIEQHVSITPLAIDFNNRDVMQKLSSRFNSINCN